MRRWNPSKVLVFKLDRRYIAQSTQRFYSQEVVVDKSVIGAFLQDDSTLVVVTDRGILWLSSDSPVPQIVCELQVSGRRTYPVMTLADQLTYIVDDGLWDFMTA
jgi:hypothetical protein